MYAERLRAYIAALGRLANVSPQNVSLLEDSLACYLSLLARAVGGTAAPPGNLLTTSVRLSLLTRSLVSRDADPALDGIHYLVAMGYEQSGAQFSPVHAATQPDHPIENEAWYRLFLSTLHYLAGGYRVQGLCTRRALNAAPGTSERYSTGEKVLTAAFEGSPNSPTLQRDIDFLTEGYPTTRDTIRGLLAIIRRRADVLLSHLGEGAIETWAQRHGLDAAGTQLWSGYLLKLRGRGITSFTREQGAFDEWLTRDADLLVQLPTGAGKSIVGELLTALHLAGGGSVVWLLPTRALVRQVKRELSGAFGGLSVEVTELPTTEDVLPLFADEAPAPLQVAVTTPERLSALARANQTALSKVTLIVFDEAHLLLDRARGVTAEQVLRIARPATGGARLALMSGLPDSRDALERTMKGLGAAPRVLVSEVRPTRRVYGVVTDEPVSSERSRVAVLVHAPKADAQHVDVPPFAVQLKDGHRQPSSSRTDIAVRLARAVHSAEGIRSVFFLLQRRSADSQALDLAEKSNIPAKARFKLPVRAVARLRLELGRAAAVEQTAPTHVASHHGGLTPLEQHLIENWVNAGVVRTIFATPTLAQGVNLPFNLSVVTYTERFNMDTRRQDPVPPGEIMNMLGRAGRAGRVADGLCLLAFESAVKNRSALMRRSGSVYFAHPVPPSVVGLGGLLHAGYAVMGGAEWPRELNGVRLADAQTLMSLALRVASTGVSDADGVQEFLDTYPSVTVLDTSLRRAFTKQLTELIENLRNILANDPATFQVALRTGLPPEYCLSVVASVAASPTKIESEDALLNWTDAVVLHGMKATSNREWQRRVLGEYSLDAVLGAAAQWRSAAPIYSLEQLLTRGDPVADRPRVGEFLNHEMSILAQFWAAIPVAAEVLGRTDIAETTRPIPALVRDGVPNVDALVWLRNLGGVDRVLSRELSVLETLPGGSLGNKQKSARRKLGLWRSGRERMPTAIALALAGALEESR